MIDVDPQTGSQALSATGHRAYAQGRFDAAVQAFQEIIASEEAAGRPVDPLVRCDLAAAFLGLGEVDSAEQGYTRVLDDAKSHANSRAEAEARSGLGYLRQAQRRFEESLDHFQAAVDLLETLGDDRRAAQVGSDLAGALYLTGRLEEAARAWRAAASDLSSSADPERIASVLLNLGGVLHQLQRQDEALEALEEAAERLPSAVAPNRLEVAVGANRALALLGLGRLDEAIDHLEAARLGAESLGDTVDHARYAAMLSDAYRIRGQLGDAIDRHLEASSLEEKHRFKIPSPAGVMVAGLQDRSLWVEIGHDQPDEATQRRRRDAEANLTEGGAAALRRRDNDDRPFVVFAPPCPGIFGPVFPRGATAIASYLNAHGVRSLVIPLSHYVDVAAGELAVAARRREVIADVVESLDPCAIGISVTFSYLYPDGLEIARDVADVDPDLPIVIGGPHVTYWDKECLEEAPAIDVVVRGEGEWTALELLRALKGGDDLGAIRGITWRAPDGTVHRNRMRPLGNVLELPEVDFHLVPERFASGMEVFGLSSRGCTFRCRYCHEFRYWGGVVREYPVERIVGELERLHLDHDNEMRGIDDSMLNMLEPYFIELMTALGRSEYLPERFGLLTRVDTISTAGLEAMRRARIPSLSVGMESGSPVVLEAMNKGVTIEQAVDGLELVRDSGIELSTFFIVGHPGDNAVESAKTTAFVDRLYRERLMTWADLSLFTPYPGTPFFSLPDKYGVRILTMDWRRWRRSNRPICELEDFSSNEIYLAYLRTLEVRTRYDGAPDSVQPSI